MMCHINPIAIQNFWESDSNQGDKATRLKKFIALKSKIDVFRHISHESVTKKTGLKVFVDW